jgi:hypothetical protein
MEISPWTIYWIGRLDGIGDVLIGCNIVFGFLSVAMVIPAYVHATYEPCHYESEWRIKAWEETKEGYRKVGRFWPFSIFAFVSCIILTTLMPSTKEAYAIWLIPQVAASDEVRQVREMSGDVLQAVEKKLDEYLTSVREIEKRVELAEKISQAETNGQGWQPSVRTVTLGRPAAGIPATVPVSFAAARSNAWKSATVHATGSRSGAGSFETSGNTLINPWRAA